MLNYQRVPVTTIAIEHLHFQQANHRIQRAISHGYAILVEGTSLCFFHVFFW